MIETNLKAVPVPREADIPAAIKELVSAVERVDGELNRLQSSLHSVTRNEPQPDMNKALRQSSCEVSGEIRDQADKLNDIAYRIGLHIDCIEL